MEHLSSILVAFFGTISFIFLGYNFSVKINLVDSPDKRKFHSGQVPLIGGLAIFFGFFMACIVSPRSMNEWRPLFFCLIPLLYAGVIDDYGDLTIRKRIVAQIFACLIMIYYGNVNIETVGDIINIGQINLYYFSPVFTVFCVLGVVNAMNLIDGLDGLCASLTLVALISILVVIKLKGLIMPVSLMVYFGVSVAAFLLVNLGILKFIVNKVFLGDAGTTSIGFILCWYIIRFSQDDDIKLVRPITCIWFLAVPIMDTLRLIIIRISKNQSPFSAGRDHIHHRLLDNGYSSQIVLVILILLASTISFVGIIFEINEIHEVIISASLILLFILYLYLVQTYTKCNADNQL